jgi:plasmid stability protein
MQYTLRNIPPQVDQALRERALSERKSLNQVVIETLMRALSLDGSPLPQRDLGDIAGSWITDPETEVSLTEQRRIDPELWR